MFTEMTREAYEKFSRKMREKGIAFEASDCTIPGDSQEHVHIEFGNLNVDLKKDIADEIDASYAQVATESVEAQKQALKEEKEEREAKDRDAEPRQERHKKWDDRMHTPTEEMMGYITGAAEEEEVVVK